MSPRSLAVGGVAILLAIAACEVGEPGAQRVAEPRDCGDVRCEGAGVRLDPDDCQCKCGDPGGNLVCAAGQVCTQDGAGTYGCVSVLCDEVACERGMACDAASGRCVCGSGAAAPTCESWQVCELGRCTPETRCAGVECGESGTCDPADGVCRCGGGPACATGERCEGEPGVESCMPDACHGVNCPDGTFCNRADSLCHCSGEAGPVCAAGQVCEQGECMSTDVCARITCPPNQYCDPNPEPGQGGFCRCGGIGPDFPRCGPHQVCDLSGAVPRCDPNEDCFLKDCARLLPGSSCDPEDGRCKCGGLEGVECGGEGQTGYACAVEDGENVCTTTCSPLGSDCTGEDSCYYDQYKKIALCLAQGTTLPDRHCKVSADCVAGAYCVQVQDTRVCRELCNLDPPSGEPDGCPDTKVCSPLPNAPDPRLGQCLPV